MKIGCPMLLFCTWRMCHNFETGNCFLTEIALKELVCGENSYKNRKTFF